ncbi:toprim domain-containing protein [Campylobacter canadensis]|uniref:toprim domain-containing protein n=1 Tax=Campylobacter canadensis TaxID=449520 RepID=UPI001CCC0528|nr:toprim domain-containing protein [Campylobacter canadensis]MBZ8002760.1 toprim domain-containing protein [Campylobacter canadensis]
MAYFSPTEKQIEFSKQIITTLNISYDENIFKDVNKMKLFLDNHKNNYFKKINQTRKTEINNFIIENIDLRWLVESLGYTEDKQKTCNSYPFYRSKNGDKFFCHIVENENIKKPFFVFYPVGSTIITDQFDIKCLEKNTQPRNFDFENAKGGNVINFLLNRTLDYKYQDVINMLYEIARDNAKIEYYGLKIKDVSDRKYVTPDIKTIENENLVFWKNNYKNEVEAKELNKNDIKNLNFRGLTYNDLLPYIENSAIKITKTKTHNVNNNIYSISCLTHNIQNGKITACGDQNNNVLDRSFFLEVEQETEKQKRDVSLPTEEKNKIINIVNKLIKFKIPEKLLKDEYLYVMQEKLITFYDKNKNKFFVDIQKRMRKGSQRGLALLNKPEKNNNQQVLIICENPIWDGISAKKIQKINNAVIVGTLGTPSQLFYSSLKEFLKHTYMCFEKVFVCFDNDEAGVKYTNDCKKSISEIYFEIEKTANDTEKQFLQKVEFLTQNLDKHKDYNEKLIELESEKNDNCKIKLK